MDFLPRMKLEVVKVEQALNMCIMKQLEGTNWLHFKMD